MTDQPRIDAHHHLWDLAVRDQEWTHGLAPLRRSFWVEDVRPELCAAGIDRTILVQTVATPDETPEFLALAAGGEADFVAGVVGWVDLTAADVTEQLARLRAQPGGDRLVGIRHPVQDEAEPGWLSRRDVRRGLAAVADSGLVYDLLIRSHQLPEAIAVVRALPQLRFVLDHVAKPLIGAGVLEPWRADVTTLAALPNVAAKLSGLITEARVTSWTVRDLRPYADAVLSAFGAERTMFGSDWPVCLMAGTYGGVVATAEELIAHLTRSERDAVFGGTSSRWYGLGL